MTERGRQAVAAIIAAVFMTFGILGTPVLVAQSPPAASPVASPAVAETVELTGFV